MYWPYWWTTAPPAPKLIKFPKDSDEDDIPDFFESPDPVAGAGADDDKSSRGSPALTQDGDGLPAKLETDGIRRFNSTSRTDQSLDWCGTGRYGGSLIKNVFVNYAGIENSTTLFPMMNSFLDDHGIVWQRMGTGTLNFPEAGKAGFIKDNRKPLGQRNVKRTMVMTDQSPLLMSGNRRALGMSDKYFDSGNPVRVDVDYVLQTADAYGAVDSDATKFLKFVVAHETSHKLSLGHHEETRTHDGQEPNPSAPDLAKFYKTSSSSDIVFWTRSYSNGGLIKTLEFLNRLENAGAFNIVTNSGNATATAESSTSHNVSHPLGRCVAHMSAGIQSANPYELILEAHLGNLMDPVVSMGEIDAMESDPLPGDFEDDIKIINSE